MVPRAALASCGLRAAPVRSEWAEAPQRGQGETGGKWCAKGGFDDENMYRHSSIMHNLSTMITTGSRTAEKCSEIAEKCWKNAQKSLKNAQKCSEIVFPYILYEVFCGKSRKNLAKISRKSAKISEITHLGLYLIFQANLADV